MPTPSWPGMNGGEGLIGQSPFAAWMSVWHRPHASTLTRTCPGTEFRHRDLLDGQRAAEVVDDRGTVGGGCSL